MTILKKQLRCLLGMYILPEVMQKYADNLHLLLYHKKDNQRLDKDLFIGTKTKIQLKEVSKEARAEFFKAVRTYYSKAVGYMIDKFPYSDEVLKHAEVANVAKRDSVTFDSLEFFVQRFNVLKPVDIDKLHAEFLSYQCTQLTPTEVSIDEVWHNLGKEFPVLAKVMKGILTIFHSNSDCERLFSFVTKTKTKFRASMSQATLANLVMHKQQVRATKNVCYAQTHSNDLLKKCKSVTYISLKKKNESCILLIIK